jgi:dephospho-CoA kinase
MAKIILGFTGQLACGKGTVASYMTEKYGASNYRFSTVLRDVLQRLYIPHNRANMQDLSTILRQRFGEDLLAKVMAEDVRNDQQAVIAVEGIRRMADIVHLRTIPEFKLIAIEADEKIRYQRLISRGENPDDASKTWEEFLHDHLAETELSIPEVMATADFVINNNGTVDDLHQQIDSIITQLQHGS